MGERKYQRAKMVLPVRITGQDASGQRFSQLAHTLDFSRTGARLGGVQAKLRVGDELMVQYKSHRGRFQVRWVNATRPEVGVENLNPDAFVFLELPEGKYLDDLDVSRVRTKAVPTPGASAARTIMKTPPTSPDSKAAEAVTAAVIPGASISPAVARPTMAEGQLADLKRKLQELKDDTDGALQLVAATAREMLSASGAAVAVTTGEEWVCRASAGVAPRIGVHFRSPKGLTGQATATGQMVICRDAERDARVNPSIWRSAQLRSAASIPILGKDKTFGVLEVFAEQPNAFDDQDYSLLHYFSELLAELITAATVSGK